ncbi:hypothetical protein YSA_03521 [Pseudomonas putida ND6]|uniref:Uncharacterized protein n=1 Tax=Pseudomonas putida ND6 TaxID=231023 RepID=I3UT50_PSEPU|nr:hypothetical protein YSA_03521 [Pseudomonas putida ND6]
MILFIIIDLLFMIILIISLFQKKTAWIVYHKKYISSEWGKSVEPCA